VKHCLELGAIDYILKNSPVDEIRRMLHVIVESIMREKEAS